MRPRTCIRAGLIGLLAVLFIPSVAVAQFPGRGVAAKEKTGSELVKLDAYAVADEIRAPGKTMLAVRFRIEPKWHIYWKNPGESGTRPEIRITGPEGLSVGTILWPRPVVFKTAWETTYGYANDATLLVPVELDRSADQPIVLTVEAEWLVCKEMCLFGSGRTTLELAPRDAPITEGAHAKAFAAARARLPRDLAAVPGAQVRLSTPEGDEPPILTLIGPMGDATEATFVPDLTPGVEVGGGLPVAATIADGTFTLDLPLDIEPANSLDGRLAVAGVVLLGNRATDPSFEIRMPLESPGATGANPDTPVKKPSSGASNRP